MFKFLKNLFGGGKRMRAKDLRDRIFGDFRNWMVKVGVMQKDGTDDPYSMDVWMQNAFHVMFDDYLKEKKHQQLKVDALRNLNPAELKEILDMRIQAEVTAKADVEKQKAEAVAKTGLAQVETPEENAVEKVGHPEGKVLDMKGNPVEQ